MTDPRAPKEIVSANEKTKRREGLQKKISRMTGYLNQQLLHKDECENVKDSPPMVYQNTLAEENRNCMRELTAGLKKQLKIIEAAVENGKQLAQLFQNFAQRLSQHDPTSSFASCLDDGWRFQLQIEKLRESFLKTVKEQLCEALDAFFLADMQEAQNARKRFEKIQHQYDSAITKTRNLKSKSKANVTKIQEAEQEERELRKQYEAAEKETLEFLRQTNRKTEIITTLKITQYWDAYNQFFKEGIEFTNSLHLKIEKYKQNLSGLMVKNPSAIQNVNTAQFKIFKMPLDQLCHLEKRNIPRIIAKCCKYIELHATEVQGIFRVSAFKDDVDRLKNEFDARGDVDFSNIDNPHLVSGILKLFLRELPEPLLTFAKYDEFMRAGKISGNEKINVLKNLVASLPEAHRLSLQRVLYTCVQIDAKKEINKMDAHNLATVLGPNLVYPKDINERASTMIQDMESANTIVVSLIVNYNEIFSEPIEIEEFDDLNKIPSTTPMEESQTHSVSSQSSSTETNPTKECAPSTPQEHNETLLAIAESNEQKNDNAKDSASANSEKKKRRFSLTNIDSPKDETNIDIGKTKTLSKVQLKHLTDARAANGQETVPIVIKDPERTRVPLKQIFATSNQSDVKPSEAKTPTSAPQSPQPSGPPPDNDSRLRATTVATSSSSSLLSVDRLQRPPPSPKPKQSPEPLSPKNPSRNQTTDPSPEDKSSKKAENKKEFDESNDKVAHMSPTRGSEAPKSPKELPPQPIGRSPSSGESVSKKSPSSLHEKKELPPIPPRPASRNLSHPPPLPPHVTSASPSDTSTASSMAASSVSSSQSTPTQSVVSSPQTKVQTTVTTITTTTTTTKTKPSDKTPNTATAEEAVVQKSVTTTTSVDIVTPYAEFPSWIRDILIDHTVQLLAELNLNDTIYAAMSLVSSSLEQQFDLVQVEEKLSSLATSFTKFFTSMKNFIVLYPKGQQNVLNASKAIQIELKNFLNLVRGVYNDEPNVKREKVVTGVQQLMNVTDELVTQCEKSVYLKLNDDIDNVFQYAANSVATVLRCIHTRTLQDLPNLKNSLLKDTKTLLRLSQFKAILPFTQKVKQSALAECKTQIYTAITSLLNIADSVAKDQPLPDANNQSMQLAKDLVVKFKNLANLLKQATLDESTQSSPKELVTSTLSIVDTLMQKSSELMIVARPLYQKLHEEISKLEKEATDNQWTPHEILVSASNISDALNQLLPIAHSKYETLVIEDKDKTQQHRFEQYVGSINTELVYIYRIRLKGCLSALAKNENKFLRLLQCVERSVNIVGELFEDEK
jgi:hypothetical protein